MAEVLALAAAAVSAGCGALLGLRSGLPAIAVLAAALAVGGLPGVPIALVTVAPWTAGRIVRSRRQLVAALGERNRQLRAEQDALAELAVRRERARIARELHDVISHHLAVMVIQAGAGRLDAPGSAARLAGIREAGDEALAELDRLVDLLRADAPDAPSRTLARLVDQARTAGLRLDYTPLPPDVRVPSEVEDAAYRVVQEGLTNAMKHAAGSDVVVRVGVAGAALEVEVRDHGAVAPSPLAGSGAGLGLAGMRERVVALGGAVEAGPLGAAGWRVRARLPLRHTSAG